MKSALTMCGLALATYAFCAPVGAATPTGPFGPVRAARRQPPAIDLRTLRPQTSSTYRLREFGRPADDSVPVGINNTGQIYGNGCTIYTGATFVNVLPGLLGTALEFGCVALAIGDADPATGRYAVAGYANVTYDGSPNDTYPAAFVAPLGPGAAAVHVYDGYAHSFATAINVHGLSIVSASYVPIGRSFQQTFTATVNDPTLSLIQPDCRQALAGCLNSYGGFFSLPLATLNNANMLLGADENGFATIVDVGHSRSQAVTTTIQASLVFGFDDVGDLFYHGNSGPDVYRIATGSTRFIPGIPGCQGTEAIAVSSDGSVLGTSFQCSNPSNDDSYFIYDARHGTRSIMQQLPQTTNLEELRLLALNDRGQLLFYAYNTQSGYEWGVLDPPGLTSTSRRTHRAN